MIGEEANERLCDLMIGTNWLEITDQEVNHLKDTFNSIIEI